jgi:tetratricopeptide (TPR) repeat protein
MRFGPALFLSLAVTTLAFAAPPRVTFERIVPAPYDLRDAEEVALVGVLGDTSSIEYFVEQFIEISNRPRTLRVSDLRDRGLPFVLDTLRRSEGADAYLAVRAFSCTSDERGGEGTVHDHDGKRVPRRESWVESRCTGRLDVLSATGQRASLAIKGEAASKHVTELSDDEREDALLHATRFAAIDAAEKITPRRVRESIALDETAPAFEEGMSLIAAGRLAEARALWESEMRRRPRVAPLHFNIAAVSEALGDRKAAEQHYAAARTLAPQEQRYSAEWKLFMRRK